MVSNHILEFLNFNKIKHYIDIGNQSEYNHERLVKNNKREYLFGIILFLINILLIIIDLVHFKPYYSIIPEYRKILYAHIFLVFIIITHLIFNKLSFKYFFENDHLLQVQHIFFCTTFIYWSVFLCITIQKLNGQLNSYFIAILGLSAIMIFTPMEILFIFIPSLVTIISCMLYISKGISLSWNILSTLFGCFFAVLIAIYSYTSSIKEYSKNKLVQEKNAELLLLRAKLEKILDERTTELSNIKEYDNLRTLFFSNVSHELRTPLNVIFSSIQLMEAGKIIESRDVPKVQRHFKIIKDNSYRLMRLINNLLDITKIDANGLDINLTQVNLVEVVENLTLSVVDFAAHKKIELIFDTTEEEIFTAVDVEKLERIVLNLLSNAFKFTNEGGNVIVTLSTDEKYAHISVKDTGIGIPKDKIHLIFDRFVQVDPSTNRRNEGTGIGLSLVKSMVELHEGYIEIHSESGKGSEFKIFLPIKQLSPMVSDICPSPMPRRLIDLELSDI